MWWEFLKTFTVITLIMCGWIILLGSMFLLARYLGI